MAQRLEGLRQQVVRDGPGIIRRNLVARDAMRLYSDLARLRGRQINRHDAQLLAVALASGISSRSASETRATEQTR